MKPATPPIQRFWALVKKDGPVWDNGTSCWVWLGNLSAKGYGRFRLGDNYVTAHRAAYRLLIGDVPPTMHVDHLCRNPSCVNPLHLEVVTPEENNRRSDSWSAQNARKTHCPLGHPYDYIRPKYRACSQCRRLKHLRVKQRATA